jgi:hypothetical protein
VNLAQSFLLAEQETVGKQEGRQENRKTGKQEERKKRKDGRR